MSSTAFRRFKPGDPFPWFRQRNTSNPAVEQRSRRRVVPAIRQFFSVEATRMERHRVACHDGADGGRLRPHRDNSTRGNPHRRLALSTTFNDGFNRGERVIAGYASRRYPPIQDKA